jgi:hypothetical protein
MKALIGDPIICECGTSGKFVTDVAGDRPITSEDFVIDAGRADPDPASGWTCCSCGVTFAQVRAPGWALQTPSGWVS